MMIWDIIRDWFVMNIWGGFTADGSGYSCFVGWFGHPSVEDEVLGYTNEIMVPVGDMWLFGNDTLSTHISLGDWLSTTSTIIVLLAVCVGLFYLTRYFFRMFAGLISGR